MSQKREDGVADPAAELVVVSALLFVCVVLLEEGDFGHLPLEVGPVLEEIAFVEFVKLVPDLVSTLRHLFILLLRDLSLIFLQLSLALLDHLRRQLIEDHILLRTTTLVQLSLSPLRFLGLWLHRC